MAAVRRDRSLLCKLLKSRTCPSMIYNHHFWHAIKDYSVIQPYVNGLNIGLYIFCAADYKLYYYQKKGDWTIRSVFFNYILKMVLKFDQQKTKQQLFHLSISLATILVCMTYLQYRNNWANVGKFWDSFIVPIVFAGEILKVILARYYDREEQNFQKQKLKKANYFTPKEIIGGLLVQFLSTVLYAFICIILGAPVLQNYEQTFVLALLLTLITVSPTVFLLGGGGSLQVCFCEKPEFISRSEDTALDLFKYNAAGAIFGAWAGSVVAPLDWDREWQVYPIPNVVGALLGAALGNIYICSRVLYATAKVYIIKKRT